MTLKCFWFDLCGVSKSNYLWIIGPSFDILILVGLFCKYCKLPYKFYPDHDYKDNVVCLAFQNYVHSFIYSTIHGIFSTFIFFFCNISLPKPEKQQFSLVSGQLECSCTHQMWIQWVSVAAKAGDRFSNHSGWGTQDHQNRRLSPVPQG